MRKLLMLITLLTVGTTMYAQIFVGSTVESILEIKPDAVEKYMANERFYVYTDESTPVFLLIKDNLCVEQHLIFTKEDLPYLLKTLLDPELGMIKMTNFLYILPVEKKVFQYRVIMPEDKDDNLVFLEITEV